MSTGDEVHSTTMSTGDEVHYRGQVFKNAAHFAYALRSALLRERADLADQLARALEVPYTAVTCALRPGTGLAYTASTATGQTAGTCYTSGMQAGGQPAAVRYEGPPPFEVKRSGVCQYCGRPLQAHCPGCGAWHSEVSDG
jgi:hypothetical protein